jgi:integrase
MAKKLAISRLHLLTTREIQTADEGDHGDGAGLLLRVRGEAVSWVFRYTSPTGRRREMGLGSVLRDSPKQTGDSLRNARDLAHAAREMLRRNIDPIDERERQRDGSRQVEVEQKAERARQRLTLARVARDYHERVIQPTRTPKHAAQWISSLENHIPTDVWNAPVDSVTPPMLLAALMKVRPHERARNLKGETVPETLRRIRQRLDSVFEDAIFHGHCTVNPADAIRRKLTEATPAKVAGELAALPYIEAPAVVLKLRAWPGAAARCFEFAVLTAARTAEALTAEWSEFDLQAGLWHVPASKMKAGEDHDVHLSPRALEVIRGQLGQHTQWVFPSAWKADAPMSNMAMLKLRDRMGLKARTTVHGLCRATFSTWANETAAARSEVIEACLAHQESDRVRRSYNRAQFTDERRALLVAWADFLARPALSLVSEQVAS